MLTVAVFPTTGFRPGGQEAGPVVTEKVILPFLVWIGPDLDCRWPPGCFSLPRVAHAKFTSTWAMTALLPSPATEPEQVTVPLLFSTHSIGSFVTSCGLAASAGTAASASAISESTATMPIFLMRVFLLFVGVLLLMQGGGFALSSLDSFSSPFPTPCRDDSKHE